MAKYKFFTLKECFPATGAAGETNEAELNKLLEDGWVPIRETPLEGAPFPGSQGEVAGSLTTGIGYIFASLILLERNEE